LMCENIEGLFVKGYIVSKSRGWRCDDHCQEKA
jgi:hypothetical protein